MIESRAGNIPMTREWRMLLCGLTDKIFVEYVGTNMSIQDPLLVIDRR